ncbi:uncharacterized protein BXZ73DRAFT_95394 [Epithele typhae]|uniref:uncharacterized protein n=1 Tax=Epithele typhae TaxID=378194 RepID=UPI002007883B|nr:uncharacterized protein BXZ73DRAFT_95394 [Epithele typhae]KAH9945876.1 hypothetical protein BXZ73DRAFT_95394 [Epithele typhae]
MASLLVSPPAGERISQILPTVKCSSCSQPVSITDLGDHVCAPAPAPPPQMPALRPPQSPRSVAALLPAKLQTLVSAAPPPAGPPAGHPSARKSSLAPAPAPPKSPSPSMHHPSSPLRSRALSSASSLSSRSADSRPERGPSPLGRSDGRPSMDSSPLSPSTPGPAGPSRVPSPNPPTPSTARSNYGGPPPAPAPPSGGGGVRSRAPSNASMHSLAGRARAGTNMSARPPPSPLSPSPADPDVIYSTGPARMRAPSNASQLRPSMDQVRRPSGDGFRPGADRMRSPSMESQRPPFAAGGPPPPLRSPASPSPIRSPTIPEPDTKTGGEAGMAGVGRRGFAAAARAAMFMSMGPPPLGPGPMGMSALQEPGQGMDGKRANAPRFLDIASATRYAASANTPPLSPGSGTASISPHSPYSQRSPLMSGPPSPAVRAVTTPVANSPVVQLQARDSRVPESAEKDRTPVRDSRTTVQDDDDDDLDDELARVPFVEKLKANMPELALDTVTAAKSTEPAPLSPTDSDSDYGGLAYADSDGDDDDDDKPNGVLGMSDVPLSTSPQPIGQANDAGPPPPPLKGEGKVRFPSLAANTESRYSSSSSATTTMDSPANAMKRSLSASTARTIAKSTGAIDRVMETLLEDATASTSTASPRPFADSQRDSLTKSPKLPMRAHTSPTMSSSSRGERGASRHKACVRCEKRIDDGRWIAMEGGSVLCDRCWKNMYLPKCRRCNKNIEKAAVSSSDGQLKGKWHRECFSCFTCEKPFPDKSFYVYDGKPFCAYHYHEANNSLCRAPKCGEPVEGPCAVSHAGARYHPEHFVCEHPRCGERLLEYYEVDGRFFCDRHAQSELEQQFEDDDASDYGDDPDEHVHHTPTLNKRVTRFIDLGSLNNIL